MKKIPRGICRCCGAEATFAYLSRVECATPLTLCDDCREALLRDILEDSSSGFVEYLLKRIKP
jgi:hypothetical protein